MSSGTILPAQPRQAIDKTGTLHSLLRTVNVIEEENRDGSESPAWVGGFNFQPESCNEALVWNPCQTPAGQLVRVRGPVDGNGEFVVSQFDPTIPVEITLNDLGAGLYDIIIEDPGQSNIASDPAGGPNDTNGLLEQCLVTAADPDAIFHIEFELNGGGNVPAGVYVLDIPVSQVVGAIVYTPSGGGTQATVSIDTNLGFTTALLQNITAQLIDDLTGTYGNPVTLGVVPSATEILVREVRCDSVAAAPANLKTISDSPELVSYAPYQIYTTVRCRRYEEGADPDFDRKANNELQIGTTKAVECELWDGALNGAANPFCLDPNPSLVGEVGLTQILSPILNATAGTGEVAPVSPGKALASLIQALGNCGPGARGVIHAPLFVGNAWNATDVLNRNGQILETAVAGHPVVIGAGYSGSAPLAYRSLAAANGFVAQPDNTAWAYATGTVQVLVTPPRPIAFDNPQVGSAHSQQSTVLENRTTVIFEREGAAVWDLCCTFAVLVDMCGEF